MDISDAASFVRSLWDACSFILGVVGFLSLIALAIGVSSRLGKAGWRFGLALSRKQINVVADNEDFDVIRDDLVRSGLIKKKNIHRINAESLSDLEKAFMIIVTLDYLSGNQFVRVVHGKSSQCGLIVYAPPKHARLSDEEISLLNSATFTTLCNFRGRLISDVLLMMLATSFNRGDLNNQ